MRKTVLWQTNHVRVSLSALIALLVVFALAGCGGGSGSSNGGSGSGPSGQNPNLPYLSGYIIDDTTPARGVVGAIVTFTGPGLPALTRTVTSSTGSFTFPNVPSGYTRFSVTSPDVNRWYNFATYLTVRYDTANCTLPLPTLVTGPNNLPSAVVMASSGANPPPAPIGGCPP